MAGNNDMLMQLLQSLFGGSGSSGSTNNPYGSSGVPFNSSWGGLDLRASQGIDAYNANRQQQEYLKKAQEEEAQRVAGKAESQRYYQKAKQSWEDAIASGEAWQSGPGSWSRSFNMQKNRPQPKRFAGYE